MHPRFQYRRSALAITAEVRRAGIAAMLAVFSFAAAGARAQNSPTQPIGRIQGADISVDSGMPASEATATAAPSIYVSNGSVVTVHSGKARLTLLGGGELDICGPAKFTMLMSGNSITLALNFGRLHVQLPANTSLQIFSPTIIATPIDIHGGSRDVTVGLDLNDSLCVLATSGAIQLEHQFTGEKLIVPQAGEFFLSGGRLVPVAGAPGGCNCAPMQEQAAPRAPAKIPEFARVTPTVAAPKPRPAPARAVEPPLESAAADEPPVIEASVPPGAVFIIPVHANEGHPVASPAREPAGQAPPVVEHGHDTITPALAFMALAPPPPAEEEPEMMLLVQKAREGTDWEFEGHVEAPEFAEAMRHALGEERAAQRSQEEPPLANARKQTEKKRGFWAGLKSLFFGNVEADEPPH